MTVDKLTCPECHKVLKPAKPLPVGKAVKCPQCGSTFKVAPAPAAPARGKAAPAKKKPAAAPAKAVAKPAAKPKEEEEGIGTYGFVDDSPKHEDEKPEINYAPDLSIKDLRGPAQAKLMRPSNWLILCGVAGVIGWLGFTVVVLIPVLFPLKEDTTGQQRPALTIGRGLGAVNAQAAAGGGGMGGSPSFTPGGGEKVKEEDKGTFFEIGGVDLTMVAAFEWYFVLLSVLPMAVGAIFAGLVTLGGVRMQSMESRGWGIAGAIMAMVPICLGGLMLLLGLGFQALLAIILDDPTDAAYYVYGLFGILWLVGTAIGAWALVTLLNEDVKAGFEYVSE
jgi:hypothetical protein